jgi:carboxyl-terminal processing protease
MKRILNVLAGLCLLVSVISCKTEDGEEEEGDAYVNSWILSTLGTYYYWTDKLPSVSDKTLSPDDYFDSLIYWYDLVTAPDGDRFSWIQDDYEELLSSLEGVVSNEIGFDMTLYLKESGSTDVVGQVNYVKKGTPAETAGVKRGMWFDRIDGTTLTTANYSDLLSFTSASVVVGFLNETYAADSSFAGFTSGTDLTIQTVASYSENPVYMDSIYSIEGHKIGYFVYNFFAGDGGTDDMAYDLQMNQVFAGFKTAGITDLILDLRYNSGGVTTSSQLLASEIVPSLSASNLYVYYEYNDYINALYKKNYGSDYNETPFTTSVMNGDDALTTVNNVGDQLSGKVYVLTGPYTASASEQVINGLKPYMDVVLIGDTTYGKNVASYSLYDEDHLDKNRWAMQPIVAKYFNSVGSSDFTAGFAPKYLVSDGGVGTLQLGDTKEALLSVAIADIFGQISTTAIARERSATTQVAKQLKMPGKRMRGLRLNNLPFSE